MSGFASIVNLDDAPVDRAVHEGMTRSVAFRGPDGREVWCDGAAGLGHTLLRTARDTESHAELDAKIHT